MAINKIINFDNVERFNPDYIYGLNDNQVKSRIDSKLVNITKVPVGKSYREIVFSNVFSLFNIILYAIAGLMVFGKYYNGLFFLFVLIPNIIIGLYEDIHARRLMGKLTLLTQPRTIAIRGGIEKEIKVDEIVLDDVIILSRDDQICVDGVVLNGTIAVNESLLTGESTLIYKNVGDTVLSGSYVVSGKAYVKAEKVGSMCYVEQIHHQANKFKRSASEILKSLRMMFRVILTIVVIMATGMFLTYYLQGKLATTELFIAQIGPISGALVSMIPSGLYLLTSAALATAVMNLSKKQARVQDFYSVEMLARVNVLCVDKTGTITDGNMNVREVSILNNKFNDNQFKQIVSNLILATGDDNNTADALKKYFDYELTAGIVSTLPFSSDNKYSAATFKGGNTYVLGAPEFMNVNDKEIVLKKASEYTRKGYRVLLLAETSTPISNNKVDGLVNALGLIILEDHIKEDAAETFRWFKENKVAIKVISGDNAVTVSEVAKSVHIEGAERYISLEGMPIQKVKEIVNLYTVFGRVSPEQKEAIILALKEAGNTVGMTGDGVNDILALKRADCSIAMATGSDASKNVSHIVLLDSNFAHLPEIVAEGRRIINNLHRTASLFLVKTSFAVITALVFLLASIITLNPDISFPFRTNHLYMWEVLGIGIGAFFLALEPNSGYIRKGFLSNILREAIPAGILVSLLALSPFFLMILQTYNVYYFDIDNVETCVGMAVIEITLFGLLVLGKISYKFSKYRLLVLIGMIVGDIAMFVYGFLMTMYNHFDFSLILVNFNQLSPLNYFMAFMLFTVFGILYIGTMYIMNVVRKEKENEDIG